MEKEFNYRTMKVLLGALIAIFVPLWLLIGGVYNIIGPSVDNGKFDWLFLICAIIVSIPFLLISLKLLLMFVNEKIICTDDKIIWIDSFGYKRLEVKYGEIVGYYHRIPFGINIIKTTKGDIKFNPAILNKSSGLHNLITQLVRYEGTKEDIKSSLEDVKASFREIITFLVTSSRWKHKRKIESM